MEKLLTKLRRFIKTFPRKHQIEYVTGLLSIPVLMTAIALNFINLQNNSKKPTPTQDSRPIIVEVKPSGEDPGSKATPIPACKKEVGPVTITSPDEGETVTGNEVCVTINYEDENYCSAVWSYRVNAGNWSEYNSNSPCFYNLPNGNTKVELRVKSTVSSDQEMLERSFIYEGNSTSSASTN